MATTMAVNNHARVIRAEDARANASQWSAKLFRPFQLPNL